MAATLLGPKQLRLVLGQAARHTYAKQTIRTEGKPGNALFSSQWESH